ncbi:Heparinase [Gammaproteobacteria bacterium]
MLGSVALYWHTLRHLKPIQFYGRVWHRLSRPKLVFQLALATRHVTGCWVAVPQRCASLIGPGQFIFLGVCGSLVDDGWNGPQKDQLWRYNQHYFDDLNALGAKDRAKWHVVLMNDWIQQNPLAHGVGWESYPTSLRIVNWIKWRLVGNELSEACLQSLPVQAQWLSKRLEWHLLGNHLFANAKALVFAGLAFQGEEAQYWLDTGLSIIERELSEQVLPDGGNFERSTMYHAIFLEDLLDLINAAQAYSGSISVSCLSQWKTIAARMLTWLEGMTHPDGDLSFFNDAAIGIAPTLAELFAYAACLECSVSVSALAGDLGLKEWPHSGYVRLEQNDAVALLDLAPIGPDYLPGHAHADTLSFELSLFGQRMLVNGGTSCYGLGTKRIRERQTVSHSTVEVDNESSSEVWGSFRVARRAYPFDLSIERTSDFITVSCSHDGYKRLPGEPVHRRCWHMARGTLLVTDTVVGRYKQAVARYIFHPMVRVENALRESMLLILPQGEQVILKILSGFGRFEVASYSPEFGMVLDTQCLAVELRNGRATVQLKWN